MNFSFSLPIGCQKVLLLHPNLHGKKVLVGLKKGPSRNKWFRHRLQNLHLPWFSYRVVVKTMGRTSVPNSSLSTPRDEPPPIIIDIYMKIPIVSGNKTECVFASLFVCFVLFFVFVLFCFLWGEVISPKRIFNVLKFD